LEGSCHEVADLANLLFFVVGLIQFAIKFIWPELETACRSKSFVVKG
jgi:hypothetical protein